MRLIGGLEKSKQKTGALLCVFLMIIHAPALRCCVSDQYRDQVQRKRAFFSLLAAHGPLGLLLRGDGCIIKIKACFYDQGRFHDAVKSD